MASKTEICNMAISHLGMGKAIANVDTEQSQEAAVCRVFYATALKAVLKDFRWPFATKYADLSLVSELGDTDEYTYSYRYPSDCIDMRKILSGIRNDNRDSVVIYKIISDSAGQLIYTDMENARAEYTYYADDPALYSAHFVLGLSYRLAVYIAPRITSGDPYGLAKKSLDFYGLEISRAKTSAINEEQPDPPIASEFERART